MVGIEDVPVSFWVGCVCSGSRAQVDSSSLGWQVSRGFRCRRVFSIPDIIVSFDLSSGFAQSWTSVLRNNVVHSVPHRRRRIPVTESCWSSNLWYSVRELPRFPGQVPETVPSESDVWNSTIDSATNCSPYLVGPVQERARTSLWTRRPSELEN